MIRALLIFCSAYILPSVVFAQNQPFDPFSVPQIRNLFTYVIDPLVQLLFAAAVFYFAYGVFTYIRNSDDSGERVKGGNHILWSTIGLFIMISVWGIIALIRSTLGVS